MTDELKSWRALAAGRFVALMFKTDEKAMIRCAEVLEVDKRDSDNEVTVWYYLDRRREASYNDSEIPLHDRKLVPEWYGHADMCRWTGVLSGTLPEAHRERRAAQARASDTEE